jgi:hypothetical protein
MTEISYSEAMAVARAKELEVVEQSIEILDQALTELQPLLAQLNDGGNPSTGKASLISVQNNIEAFIRNLEAVQLSLAPLPVEQEDV